jgi:hypothetical protein
MSDDYWFQQRYDDAAFAVQVDLARHPEGCAFCPAELLGLERDRNGDPLCATCPHLRNTATVTNRQTEG